jgi:hypothetical protein
VRHSLGIVAASMLAVSLAAAPGWAARSRGPRPVQLTYHGGPLLQHPQVATLFWGADWEKNEQTGYFNGFFQTLFADGRYVGNLAQYSAGDYTIGNGTFAATVTDTEGPPATVHDDQIQAEIRAQIAAGKLPAPTADTVYFVFTPPSVEVVDAYGANSVDDFAGYHDYASGSDGFAYAVIPDDTHLKDPHHKTVAASHELAEAITDPEPGDTTLGWYDDRNGELGDIPVSLYAAGRIQQADLLDELDAPDGTVYLVQKEWSNEASAPVAFTAATGS